MSPSNRSSLQPGFMQLICVLSVTMLVACADGGITDMGGPPFETDPQQEMMETEPEPNGSDTPSEMPTPEAPAPVPDEMVGDELENEMTPAEDMEPTHERVEDPVPELERVPEEEPEPEPEPEPETDPEPAPTQALPEFPHFDTVIEQSVPDQQVWAHFIHVDRRGGAPRFQHVGYGETSNQTNFWPASTIKLYTATAALVLLNQQGFSLDAEATFSRQTGGRWVEDVTLSFREIIRRTFNCSSNEAYTLLLRFAGIDWINQDFFTREHGFDQTTLMRGYVTSSARPWVYRRPEPQRILVEENGESFLREHTWSGVSYADQTGCTVYNSVSTANCTSPRDMAEHLRRVMFHESLPANERFDVDSESLNWMRRGSGATRVLNNDSESCGGPGSEGVDRVFPNADFYHKGGLVSEYRLDLQYIHDHESGTEYVLAVAIDSSSSGNMRKISEEVARMAKTPNQYVFLDYLRDHVNPVTADLVVYSATPATLDLVTKPYAEDGFDGEGWTALPGSSVEVPAGISAHEIQSACLDRSEQIHIRGRLRHEDVESTSDLHYVIVDAAVACMPAD